MQGASPRDMEDVFRRGGEWSEGQELLLLLSRRSDGADEFLDRLAQLAEQLGALPVTRGPVVFQGSRQGPECAAVTDAFMARFPLPSQLQEFAQSAPVQALLENQSALPLQAEYCFEFETAPTQKSQLSPPAFVP